MLKRLFTRHSPSSRPYRLRWLIGFVLVLLVLLAFPAEAQRLYKWVDAEGNVHFSDQVPPDQAQYAREELDKSGVVRQRVERALTAEERDVAEAEALAEKERKAHEERNAQEDAVFLSFYPTRTHLEEHLEGSIVQQEKWVNDLDEALIVHQRTLGEHLAHVARLEGYGSVISKRDAENVQKAQEHVQEVQRQKASALVNLEEMRQHQLETLERYDRLTGQE